MLNWIILALSAWALWGVLCRLWALDWRQHRAGVLAGYMLLGVVAVLVGGAAAQGVADVWHLAPVLMTDSYLLASDHAWRQGVPASVGKES